jgi:5-methylcytosine-specific restriction endonuclease McrA
MHDRPHGRPRWGLVQFVCAKLEAPERCCSQEMKTCLQCGSVYAPKKMGAPSLYCGATCKERARKKTPQRVEAMRAAIARHYYRNRENVLQKHREWREKNPEKCSIHSAAYRARHPEAAKSQVRAGNHRRRAQKTSAGGSYTRDQWQSLLLSFGNRCLWCGNDSERLTVDHVIPVSLGGTSDISNLQPLCFSCNSRKRNRVMDFRGAALVAA